MLSLLLRILQAIFVLTNKVVTCNAETQKTLRKLLNGQREIEKTLAQILDILEPGPAVKLEITAFLEDGTILNGVTQMDLRDDQQVALTIQPVDKKGKPALVDGVPVWAGSDDTVITVTAASDGMSAVVVGVAPGTARVVVTADADLGSGVTDLTGTLDFNVTGGSAVTLNITAGTPTDQA